MEEIDRNELLAIQDSYSDDTRLFVRFLDERGLSFGYAGLREYIVHLRGRGYAASTINKPLSAAKSRLRLVYGRDPEAMSMLDRFEMERALKEIKGVKLKTKGVDADKVLSLEEVRRLLDPEKAPERIRLFIEFLASTGARVSEMAGIRLAHLERAPGHVRIRIVGKGSKERFLKVQQDLVDRAQTCFGGKAYLFETKSGLPYRRQYISDSIARLGRALLRRKISAHTLRHTFATLQVQKTRKIKALSLYLGHSTTSITQDMYVHEELDLDDLSMDLSEK
jgi:integrase